MAADKNPRVPATFRLSKKKGQIIGYAIGAALLLLLSVVGMGLLLSGDTPGKQGAGAVMALAGAAVGIFLAIKADDLLTNKKYEQKCDPDFFLVYDNLALPESYTAADSEIYVELDVDEYETARKIQTDLNKRGVFLRSNTSDKSTGGNYDAFFIPSTTKALLTRPASEESDPRKKAARVYTIKRGDRKVEMKNTSNGKSPFPTPTSPNPPPCGNPPAGTEESA